MIVLSGPHPAPGPSAGAAHTVSGSPPESATFLIFSSAKNNTQRPLGETTNFWAPSVPGSARASTSASERAYNRSVSYTIVAPSGVMPTLSAPNSPLMGTVKRITRPVGAGAGRHQL